MITNSWVEMVFWDVQHGHATYIKSPNGKHIVVDLGIGSHDDNNTAFSPLLHLKNNYNVAQLDFAIITHPHLDHIDDILNFDALNPKVLLRPKHLKDEEVYHDQLRDRDKPKFEKYVEISNRYNQTIAESYPAFVKPENYGGLQIQRFLPIGCPRDNFNNHSIISVFTYADVKVIVPGDNEDESFEELLQSEAFIKAISGADILLAPHHGRISGYYDDFVNLIYPRLTIVSDGRFCDTSANPRYSSKSRGWSVFKGGIETKRKCLTTNSDGEVFVRFGYDENGKRFLNVRIK
ncbi:MAG: ComEC/Rec2 family competence protein [Agriterribacter sp.]